MLLSPCGTTESGDPAWRPSRACDFYLLGLRPPRRARATEHVGFIQAGASALALWNRAELAKDGSACRRRGRGVLGHRPGADHGSNAEVDAPSRAWRWWRDPEAGRGGVLGRLFGYLRRPRWTRMGSRVQPVLAAGRARQRHAARVSHVRGRRASCSRARFNRGALAT